MPSHALDSEETTPPSSSPILFGRLDSLKPLIDALTCIYSPVHKGQDVLLLTQPSGGLKFTVEETGSLLASVILPSNSFLEFKAPSSPLRIRLNLSVLLECLSIFSHSSVDRYSPAAVTISYSGDGHPLELRVRDHEKDCVIKLATLATDAEDADFGFHRHEMVNMAVVDAETLKEALGELDYGGATSAELRMAPEAPRFVVSSPAWTVGLDGAGVGGRCEVQLADPGDRNAETFQAFRSKRMQTGSFLLVHLGRCVKALGLSESCKVEMNSGGMVSIMCRMKGEGTEERCFVEFVIVAQEIEEDEDGDEDEEEDDEDEGADSD